MPNSAISTAAWFACPRKAGHAHVSDQLIAWHGNPYSMGMPGGLVTRGDWSIGRTRFVVSLPCAERDQSS